MNSTITEQDRAKATASLLKNMEETAANIRALILSMPPQGPIGSESWKAKLDIKRS